MEQLKQMLADSIKEQLDEQHPNDFPGEHERTAEKMADLIIDDDKTYKEAEKEVIKGNDEKSKDDDDFMKVPGRREH